MHRLHLTAVLRDRPVAGRAVTTEPEALRASCRGAVMAAGLQPVGEFFHRVAEASGAAADAPIGLTGVVRPAESPLAVHTRPELAAWTLDGHVCHLGPDNSQRAQAVLGAPIDAFAPQQIERHALHRGGSAP